MRAGKQAEAEEEKGEVEEEGAGEDCLRCRRLLRLGGGSGERVEIFGRFCATGMYGSSSGKWLRGSRKKTVAKLGPSSKLCLFSLLGSCEFVLTSRYLTCSTPLAVWTRPSPRQMNQTIMIHILIRLLLLTIWSVHGIPDTPMYF